MAERLEEHEQVVTGLRKLLNQHGHGFHFAVMGLADKLKEAGDSRWRYVATEIPVVAGESTTHVDFILKQVPESRDNLITFLVAECKRVNNKFSKWCFAQTPYTENQKLVFEQFHLSHHAHSPALMIKMNTLSVQATRPAFGLGLELKGNGKSEDCEKTGRGAISDSVAQVLRGVSGFINHELSVKSKTDDSVITLRFIPVVFTTANLWVTDADLREADLSTGDLAELACKETDWLWFNHNRSPMLAHDFRLEQTSSRKDLEFEFVRSVAIVNVSGIETFLLQSVDDLMGT